MAIRISVALDTFGKAEALKIAFQSKLVKFEKLNREKNRKLLLYKYHKTLIERQSKKYINQS
jgi:hypothetical protein